MVSPTLIQTAARLVAQAVLLAIMVAALKKQVNFSVASAMQLTQSYLIHTPTNAVIATPVPRVRPATFAATVSSV